MRSRRFDPYQPILGGQWTDQPLTMTIEEFGLARIMWAMQAMSLFDVVRLALAAGLNPPANG